MFEIQHPYAYGGVSDVPVAPETPLHGGGALSPVAVASGMQSQQVLTRIVPPPSPEAHVPAFVQNIISGYAPGTFSASFYAWLNKIPWRK